MIEAAVGEGGANRAGDVRTVQWLLLRIGIDPGGIDGVAGPRLIAAIRAAQDRFGIEPDGRIDPGGATLARLRAAPARWDGDSSSWSQERKLASLHPTFRPRVSAVIARLRIERFRPVIVYGWRSVDVQQRLFRAGTSRVRFSFHNAQTPGGLPAAWAADLVDERWYWREPDAHVFFRALGKAAKAEGLVWGGDWKFRDWAHVQGRPNGDLAAVRRESGA